MRRTIATDIIVPAALFALPLIVISGCGDSKSGSRTAEAASVTAPPVVASVAAVESVPAVPESVTYEDAESVYHARRYSEATSMFEAYVRRNPENPWGHYMLGLSAWKSGDRTVAEQAFLAALERDPDHVKSLLNLSRVLLDDARPKEALEQVTAALQIDPESADAYRVMGRVRAALGQTDEALDAYRQALSLDDEDVWSMNNMGLLFIQTGQYEEALGPLARAIQLRDDVAAFHNNLGVALERTGHFVKASESYRAALAADSTYARAQVSLQRVDQRMESSTTPPVDLGALGDAFSANVRRWQEARVAATAQ